MDYEFQTSEQPKITKEAIELLMRNFLFKHVEEFRDTARERAFLQIIQNPNNFFFRNRIPGERILTGKFTDEEREAFLKRFRYFTELGISGSFWGYFAVPIKGRLGYHCSSFFRQLLEEGVLEHPNYVIEEDRLKCISRKKMKVSDDVKSMLYKEAINYIISVVELGTKRDGNIIKFNRYSLRQSYCDKFNLEFSDTSLEEESELEIVLSDHDGSCERMNSENLNDALGNEHNTEDNPSKNVIIGKNKEKADHAFGELDKFSEHEFKSAHQNTIEGEKEEIKSGGLTSNKSFGSEEKINMMELTNLPVNKRDKVIEINKTLSDNAEDFENTFERIETPTYCNKVKDNSGIHKSKSHHTLVTHANISTTNHSFVPDSGEYSSISAPMLLHNFHNKTGTKAHFPTSTSGSVIEIFDEDFQNHIDELDNEHIQNYKEQNNVIKLPILTVKQDSNSLKSQESISNSWSRPYKNTLSSNGSEEDRKECFEPNIDAGSQLVRHKSIHEEFNICFKFNDGQGYHTFDSFQRSNCLDSIQSCLAEKSNIIKLIEEKINSSGEEEEEFPDDIFEGFPFGDSIPIVGVNDPITGKPIVHPFMDAYGFVFDMQTWRSIFNQTINVRNIPVYARRFSHLIKVTHENFNDLAPYIVNIQCS